MPSDNRLHPLSFVFALGAQARALLIPAILFLATARYVSWQLWSVPFVALYAGFAVVRSLSYSYRYGEDEIVVRTGFIFRNERHIPYHRIQNIDAIRNPLHRMLGVAEVRVQTAGGQEPEATMTVLPLGALDEMRRRVLAPRRIAAADDTATGPRTLLSLGLREILLHGFIENRGMVPIGAALGLVWEFGLLDRLTTGLFGPQGSGRGLVRGAVGVLFGGQSLGAGKVALTLVAIPAFLLLVRLISMLWAAIRLHGFTIVRTGNDLRSDYGLFTRVSATIPIGRIQTLTVQEGPWHRLTARASVQVATAGGHGPQQGPAQREWLAPILRKRDLPRFLSEVLPGLDVVTVPWQGLHPRAFRRALKPSLLVAAAIAIPISFLPGWWDLALIAALVAWAVVDARLSVRHLGYAVTGEALFFRSGWMRRSTTAARFLKLQVVTMGETPFDRRSAMASVRIDTAGAASAPHRIAIPYLGIDVARRLHDRLATEAARTVFRW